MGKAHEMKNRGAISMKIYQCWNCGDAVADDRNIGERAFCYSCEKNRQKDYDDNMRQYLTMKTKLTWDRSLRFMERQADVDVNSYYEEAMYVKEMALADFNKFQSSYEMMAAMELLKNRIKAKTQYKILRYKVDFLLPDLKVVLEIDGKLHDFKVKKDSDRDVAILTELNSNDRGWEIVRIPTKYLDQNIKQLVPAIKAVKKEKQRLRKANGGFIPASFNRSSAYQNRKIAELSKDSSLKELDSLLEDTTPDEL